MCLPGVPFTPVMMSEVVLLGAAMGFPLRSFSHMVTVAGAPTAKLAILTDMLDVSARESAENMLTIASLLVMLAVASCVLLTANL